MTDDPSRSARLDAIRARADIPFLLTEVERLNAALLDAFALILKYEQGVEALLAQWRERLVALRDSSERTPDDYVDHVYGMIDMLTECADQLAALLQTETP